MSEIKVDTLTGKTTANDITVTVGATATAKLEQGLAKAWFHYNQTTGSEGVRDSFNISSVFDDTTGVYSNTFTNNMNNAFYAVTSGVRGNRNQFNTDTGTTTGRSYRTADAGNTVIDADSNCWITTGDLA
jgi:hypothetical protein